MSIVPVSDGHQTLACQRRVPLLPGYNGTSADGQEQYDPAKPTGDQYDPAKPTDESDMNPFRCSVSFSLFLDWFLISL